MLRRTVHYKVFFGYLKILLSKTRKKLSLIHESHENIYKEAVFKTVKL